MIIHFHHWIIERRLTGDHAGIAGSPPGVGPFIGIGGSPFDDTGSIVRSSNGECQISVRSPADFYRYISYGGPMDRCSGIGLCPTGSRRMRKSGEASCGRRANFNCVLTLPGHRRMSAGWVLYRRITTGFLQDSSHGSPCGDPAIDLALF